jgi:hypothetical protein
VCVRRVLVGSGGLLSVIAAVLPLAMASQRYTEVPFVYADPRPIRVRPENPGGMQIVGAAQVSYEDDVAAKLGPEAERPDPAALHSLHSAGYPYKATQATAP